MKLLQSAAILVANVLAASNSTTAEFPHTSIHAASTTAIAHHSTGIPSSVIATHTVSKNATVVPTATQSTTTATATVTPTSNNTVPENCDFCSYKDGTEFRLVRPVIDTKTNTNITQLDDFVRYMGPSWRGHRICCKEIEMSFNITNFAGQKRLMKLVPRTTIHPLSRRNFQRRDVSVPQKKVSANAFIKERPICLPLISSNPVANPYHPSIAAAGSEARNVIGFPVPVKGDALVCTQPPCSIAVAFTVSFSSTQSYSVSDGTSIMHSNTLGQTTSVTDSSSVSQSITKAMEVSHSMARTTETGGSQEVSVSDTLTKMHEVSSSQTHTEGSETTNSETNSSEQSLSKTDGTSSSSQSGWENGSSSSRSSHDDWNQSNEAGGSATVSANGLFVSGSATVDYHHTWGSSGGTARDDTTTSGRSGSNTSENSSSQTSNRSTSKSQMRQQSRSSSDASTSGVSDSISNAFTKSKTDSSHWSNSATDTVGNSVTDTFGSTTEYSKSKSLSSELSKTEQLARTVDKTSSQTTGEETTLQTTKTFNANVAGSYQVVCLFEFPSRQIPWACIDDKNVRSVIYTDFALKSVGPISSDECRPALLTTEQIDNYMVIDDPGFSKAVDISVSDIGNSIRDSQPYVFANKGSSAIKPVTVEATILKSLNTDPAGESNYFLKMSYTGNMYITNKKGQVFWKTDTVITGEFNTNTRLIINQEGHILLQKENMFMKQPVPAFQQVTSDIITGDDVISNYTTIWSNVPKNMRFTIGSRRAGYRLVLVEKLINFQSQVDLVLYDGGGSKVWCARNIMCKSPLVNILKLDTAEYSGFRFPLDYVWPTDTRTDLKQTIFDKSDPHNFFDTTKYTLAAGNTFDSEASRCGPILQANQYIQSPNKRFSLILEETGNLIFKDGIRTMWETYTSKLSYLVAPVSLHLSIEGFMYIKDAHNALIYSTFSGIPLGKSIQSQLSITDGGDLVIKNSTNTIWNQLALTGANNKYTLFEKRRVYCDSPCHKCLPRYPQPLVALNSDGYEFSPKVSGYLNSTQLCSKSGQFCVYTNTSRIALNDNVIFPVVKPGETVDTTENGRTYLLDLSYDGNLRYFDLNNNNTQVWKSDSKKGFGPFTSSVSDSGLFGVYDSDNKLVWSYQWYDKSVVNWKTSDNGDWAAKCNSIGDDFQTVKASSPQDCQTQCFNTGNCNAWGLEGDVCYFKYKLNASRDTFKPAAKTDFCGLVKPKIIWFTSPEGDWGDHCDWPGNDNSMVFANNVKDCQAKCNGDGLCNSWAFFGNNCYLKNKPEPTRAKFEARTGIISCGIAKSKILWHGSAEGDWGEYCDWPGDDYKNVPGNDPVACQSVCFGDGNCNAWAITAGTCYLKIKPQPTRAGFQVRSSLQYCGMVKSKPLALPYYSIRSIQNKNYCIDYAARNLAVTVYDCNDSSPQKWAFKSNDKIESLFDGTGISYRDNSNPLEVTSEKAYYKLQYSNSRLIQMSANQCIGVPKGEYSNYAKLIYETCNGGDNQKWELVGPTFTSYYMQVRNQKNNVFCMNLDEGRNILTISSCNTVDTQRWNFYGSNNSVYSVKGKSLTYAAVDGKYMLIGGGAYLSVRLIGGKIQTLDGYWCVTVPGGNFVEGQQLAIEVCNGDEHQNWTVANI